MGRLVASRPDVKYVSLNLILIGCIKTSFMYISRIMRHIEIIQTYRNDTNVLSMI